MRTKHSLTALAVMASCYSSATVIEEMTKVFEPSLLPTPGYGYLSNATLPGTVVGGKQSLYPIQFSGLWGQFGRNLSTPENWSTYNGYLVTIENHEPIPLSLGFRMETTPIPNGPHTRIDFAIGPRQKLRFFVDYTDFDPRTVGMHYGAPALDGEYVRIKPSAVSEGMSTVYRWQIYSREVSPARIGISAVYGLRVSNNDLTGLADAFGQFTRRNWPGKPLRSTDFANLQLQEEADLTANPGPGELSGSNTLPLQAPASHWRIVKLSSGKQYMVHPSGKLFWSFGITSVNGSSPTIVQGRESMFTYLPPVGNPLSQFFGTHSGSSGNVKTFDFYRANLFRKYGANLEQGWSQTAVRRLKSWGFNTVGAGSDLPSYNQEVPFVMVLTTNEYPHRLSVPYAYWRTLPDPYGTDFQSFMVTKWKSLVTWYNPAPNFMGLFVDSEQNWGAYGGDKQKYQTPLATLYAPATQPSKAAFLAQLQAKYGTIQAFNTAWGVSVASWTNFNLPLNQVPEQLSSSAKSDCSTFLRAYAATYYSKVRNALNQLNFKNLYLGSKNVTAWTPREVFEAAEPHVDAHSMTIYLQAYNVDWSFFDSFSKPFVIAEFGFGARDRGGFSGGFSPDMECASQLERGQRAKDYILSALATKNVIGVHWYTYIDQPITGRPMDGENMNLGAVSVADVPFYEVISSFREMGHGLYSYRGL